MTKYYVAIVAYGKYAQPGTYWADDDWLRVALVQQGHRVDIIDWTVADNLTIYDAIYVSSTWNFHHDPARFLAWLAACEADGRSRLINNSHLLRDGVDKFNYMQPLQENFGEQPSADGSITPTRFYRPEQTSSSFEKWFDALRGDAVWVALSKDSDLVLKPACSADGLMTYLYNRTGTERVVAWKHQDKVLTELPQVSKSFDEIMAKEDNRGAMLQVYQSGVEAGEYSLTFFNEVFSHAVRKPGGFRQDVSKDRVYVSEAGLPTGMLDFAQRSLAFMRERYGEYALTRSRVDMFAGEDGPVLSELEFLEPNINLRNVPDELRPDRIEAYAAAILAQIDRMRS